MLERDDQPSELALDEEIQLTSRTFIAAVQSLRGEGIPPTEKQRASKIINNSYHRSAEILQRKGYEDLLLRIQSDIDTYYAQLFLLTVFSEGSNAPLSSPTIDDYQDDAETRFQPLIGIFHFVEDYIARSIYNSRVDQIQQIFEDFTQK